MLNLKAIGGRIKKYRKYTPSQVRLPGSLPAGTKRYDKI